MMPFMRFAKIALLAGAWMLAAAAHGQTVTLYVHKFFHDPELFNGFAAAASANLGRPVKVEFTDEKFDLSMKPADGLSVGVLAGRTLKHFYLDQGMPIPGDAVAGIGMNEWVVLVNSNVRDLSGIKSIAGRLRAPGSWARVGSCVESLAKVLPSHPKGYGFPKPSAYYVLEIVDAVCVDPMEASATIAQGGGVRAIATTGSVRSKLHPGVPTLAELKISNEPIFDWMFIVAPPGMKAATKQALTRAFAAAVQSQSSAFQQKLGMTTLSKTDAADVKRLQAFLQRRINEAEK
jgi:hypothetical protein